MKTILYNTTTSEVIKHNSDGNYIVDGVRSQLPHNIVELQVFDIPYPVFNAETERVEGGNWVVDLENGTYARDWNVIPLTPSEIALKNWKHPEYIKRLDVNENVIFSPMGSAYYAYLQLQGFPVEKDGSTIKIWLNQIEDAHKDFIAQLKGQGLLTEINL